MKNGCEELSDCTNCILSCNEQEHYDIEGKCDQIEKIVNKKVCDITEDEKEQMTAFKNEFEPVYSQLKVNVDKAREMNGKEEEISFNEFCECIAGFKRLLRMTKKTIQEVITM